MNDIGSVQDKTNFKAPFRRLGVIKICGMKIPGNINAVAALHPDFMGFIFYPKSPRYAEPMDISSLEALPKSIKKIGVFVNEDLERILTLVFKYKLDGVQLHGTENVEICQKLRDAGLIVLKAFSIAEAYNFKVTGTYEGSCDYFLFDTKTDAYGGSGVKFDWSMLNEHKGNTPFLLSGGIGADDAEAILKIDHPKMAGIDLNSKFEISPGLKNVELLKGFLQEIK